MVEKKLIKWLVKRKFDYFHNSVLGSKFPDLIAIKGNKITAFELKSYAGEISKAVGQCLFYLNDSNSAYIVIPKEESEFLSDITLKILRENGIGLIAVGSDVRILIEAKDSYKNNLALIGELRSRRDSEKTLFKGEDCVKKKILETLKEHPEGLSFLDIAKYTTISRVTIAKYVMVLEVEGMVSQRKVGTAKLCCLKGENNVRR
jgi:hypothetical protein